MGIGAIRPASSDNFPGVTFLNSFKLLILEIKISKTIHRRRLWQKADAEKRVEMPPFPVNKADPGAGLVRVNGWGVGVGGGWGVGGRWGWR